MDLDTKDLVWPIALVPTRASIVKCDELLVLTNFIPHFRVCKTHVFMATHIKTNELKDLRILALKEANEDF